MSLKNILKRTSLKVAREELEVTYSEVNDVTIAEDSKALSDELDAVDDQEEAIVTLEGLCMSLERIRDECLLATEPAYTTSTLQHATKLSKHLGGSRLLPSVESFSNDNTTALDVSIEGVWGNISDAVRKFIAAAMAAIRRFISWLGDLFTRSKQQEAKQEVYKEKTAEIKRLGVKPPETIIKYQPSFRDAIPVQGQDMPTSLKEFVAVVRAGKDFIDTMLDRITKLKGAETTDWQRILTEEYPRPSIPHSKADVDGVVCSKTLIGGIEFQFHGPWKPGKHKIHITVSREDLDVDQLPLLDSAAIDQYIASLDDVVAVSRVWQHYKSACEVVDGQLQAVEKHYSDKGAKGNRQQIELAGMRCAASCSSGMVGAAHTLLYHVNSVVNSNQALIAAMLRAYGNEHKSE